jgi:hypothetical protein
MDRRERLVTAMKHSRLCRPVIVVALAAAPSPALAGRFVLETKTAVSFVDPADLNREYKAVNTSIAAAQTTGYSIPEVKNLLNQALYAGYEMVPGFDLGLLFTFPLISTVRTQGRHPTTGEVTTEIKAPHLNLALAVHITLARWGRFHLYTHPFIGATFWSSTTTSKTPAIVNDQLRSVSTSYSSTDRTLFFGGTVGGMFAINETFRVVLEGGYHRWRTNGPTVQESTDPTQMVGRTQTFPASGKSAAVTSLDGYMIGLGLSAAFDVTPGSPR